MIDVKEAVKICKGVYSPILQAKRDFFFFVEEVE